MGNALSPCFQQNPKASSVKLIFYEGTTRILTGRKRIAGEIMFEFPDNMVCHADSFFIGQPIPALAIDDNLISGHTYFILPIDRFSCGILSASSIVSSLNTSPKPTPMNFGDCPFEYIKGANGRVLIKVVPEFIARLITTGSGKNRLSSDCDHNTTISTSTSPKFLCSTPELKKHYDMLVGSREQVWSPKLETISEYKVRFSPCRFIGLEWKQKENDFRS